MLEVVESVLAEKSAGGSAPNAPVQLAVAPLAVPESAVAALAAVLLVVLGSAVAGRVAVLLAVPGSVVAGLAAARPVVPDFAAAVLLAVLLVVAVLPAAAAPAPVLVALWPALLFPVQLAVHVPAAPSPAVHVPPVPSLLALVFVLFPARTLVGRAATLLALQVRLSIPAESNRLYRGKDSIWSRVRQECPNLWTKSAHMS